MCDEVSVCQTSGTATQNYSVPSNGAQKLVDRNVIKIKCLSFFVCKPVSLNFEFDFNNYKCTDRISNKSEFSLSPYIIPTGIEFES